MMSGLRTGARRAAAAALLLAAGIAGAVRVARAEIDDLFYPPELVQRFGRDAGLSDADLEKVRKDFLAARMQMVDIEPRLAKLHLEIESLVGDDAAPLDQILAKVEALGAAETEMKRVQIGLMVRTRRGLAPEVRHKLDEVKARMAPRGRPGEPAAPPAPPMPPPGGGPR
jgi:hypothetical protein